MENGEYLPNSIKSKEEAAATPVKKVEKVIPGVASTKKRSETGRLAEVFISEDINNVKSYMMSNIIVPAIKKAASDTVATIADVFTSGINTLLWGEAGRNINTRGVATRNTPYGSYSTNVLGAVDPRRMDSRVAPVPTRSRTGYNYDDIIVASRGQAEDVLSQMDEMINQYGMVSVADLYEMVGLKGNYTDNKYGWTNLSNSGMVRNGSAGYLLKLPRALPFD